MKRETTITNEIAALERTMNETMNATLKKALKSKIDKLNAEMKGFTMTAKQLALVLLKQRAKIKALAKRDFNDLIRQLAKKPEYSFLKSYTRAEIEDDMSVRAKPVGYRFKGRGNYDVPTKREIIKGKRDGTVYSEHRAKRSDVSLAVQLKTGGSISSLGIGDKLKTTKATYTITGYGQRTNATRDFEAKDENDEVYNLRCSLRGLSTIQVAKGRSLNFPEQGETLVFKEGGSIPTKYCVVMSGGSIGTKGIMNKQGRKLVETFETREEAAAYAKRRNSQLSPGEKTHYKIKFFIAPYKESDFITKMNNGGQISSLKTKIQELQFDYQREMSSQNNKSSLGRSYADADSILKEIKKLENELQNLTNQQTKMTLGGPVGEKSIKPFENVQIGESITDSAGDEYKVIEKALGKDYWKLLEYDGYDLLSEVSNDEDFETQEFVAVKNDSDEEFVFRYDTGLVGGVVYETKASTSTQSTINLDEVITPEYQVSEEMIEKLYQSEPKLGDPYFEKQLIEQVKDIAYYKITVKNVDYILSIDTMGNWDDKWFFLPKSKQIETGSAALSIDLMDSTITVRHAVDGNILFQSVNVEKGSWDKILLAIKQTKGQTIIDKFEF